MNVRVSEQDLRMLTMVAKGDNYKQIAAALGIKLQTVRSRMCSVNKAFGAKSYPHLVAMLMANGVLEADELKKDLKVFVHGTGHAGAA